MDLWARRLLLGEVEENPDQPENNLHACRAHRSIGTKTARERRKNVTEEGIMRTDFCQDLSRKEPEKVGFLA